MSKNYIKSVGYHIIQQVWGADGRKFESCRPDQIWMENGFLPPGSRSFFALKFLRMMVSSASSYANHSFAIVYLARFSAIHTVDRMESKQGVCPT